MRLPKRRRQVQVDLSETAEARRRKAAEADWDWVNEHISEVRYLRDERNEISERFALAFRLHEEGEDQP